MHLRLPGRMQKQMISKTESTSYRVSPNKALERKNIHKATRSNRSTLTMIYLIQSSGRQTALHTHTHIYIYMVSTQSVAKMLTAFDKLILGGRLESIHLSATFEKNTHYVGTPINSVSSGKSI